jgi:hypothetical protein
VPNIPVLAELIVGPRWWVPAAGVDDAQACAVIHMTRKGGFCHRHAALLGDLFALALRDEATRRRLLPGTVEVRHVQITAEPFEQLSAPSARRHGLPLVDRVRDFVRGSQLGAVVELDLDSRRARITFQLHEGQSMTGIESERLIHTSAAELAATLRDRKTADRTG